MAKGASIGIDVGGSKTRLALFDKHFKLLRDARFSTPETKREFVSALTGGVRDLVQKAIEANRKISAVGIGFAGSINSAKGIVRSSPNIPYLKGFSFEKTIGKLCRCKVALLNDVQAGLYGELKIGNAIGYPDVFAVFIGTGIGGAIAVNGQLRSGVSGQAGDIGHYLMNAFGPLAGSDRHGNLDDFASRLAIAGHGAVLAAKKWAPHILKSAGTDVKKIRSSVLAQAVHAGDKVIEELVRRRMQIVGIALSNMVDFFSPHMIVLGGGLTDGMPFIVREEVESGIRTHSTPAAARGLKIVTTKYEKHAVTIGAAVFATNLGKP